MASERPEAAVLADKPTTTTRSVDDGLFDADGDADDDGSMPLMHSSGAFSPRANGAGPSIPPPDEIQGPPRRPFRRRHGASPTRPSPPHRHHHRAHDYPSESGGFGGRRNSLTASTTSSSSAHALSVGTRLLKVVLSNWDRALVLSALVAATVLVSTRGVETLKAALLWLQRHSGWSGWGIFLACYALAVSLLLPGVAAVLGSGFVFGFWRGLLAVWVGGAIGQVGAFLLSRYLLGGCVSGLLKGSRLWASIDAAVEVEGWKLLLILRLSPIIPYNLLNVAAAATKIHLVPFALASAVGILPECSLLVYAGSLAESITAAVSGEATHKKITWILGGLTIAAGVAAGVAATLLVRRAVRRAAARADAIAEAEEEEEAAQELARGGFLLSLDHETFDRSSFGGDASSSSSSSWWLSPQPPTTTLTTLPTTTTTTLATIPSSSEGEENGNGSSTPSSVVPPKKQQKGSNGALIDV